MLSTPLSFPEIAEEMFLSPHTVKSHAASIYRKLGACQHAVRPSPSRGISASSTGEKQASLLSLTPQGKTHYWRRCTAANVMAVRRAL